MSTDLAVRAPELDRLARLGQWLALSETGSQDVAARGAAAALRLYYAEQLGLPPLAAAELSVIKGRLFVSAQLLRAIAEKNGYRILRVNDNAETCTAVLIDRRTGEEIGRTTFTIQDAKTAGLIRQGSAWQSHPARMLWARASKNVIVDFAPAVALGIMLDDEAAEVVEAEAFEELGGDPGAATGAAVGMGPPSPPNPVPGGAAAPDSPVGAAREQAAGETAVLEESTADEDEPRPDKPSTAQLRKLDALVGQMRRDQQITTEQVAELAGLHPTFAASPSGELHWADLRVLLNADEASKLISELGYWAYKHPPADTADHGQTEFAIPEKAKAKR